jgi:hypothetical protein
MSSFACANIPWATEIWLSLVGEVIYRATLEIRFRIAQGYNMVMKSWSHGVMESISPNQIFLVAYRFGVPEFRSEEAIFPTRYRDFQVTVIQSHDRDFSRCVFSSSIKWSGSYREIASAQGSKYCSILSKEDLVLPLRPRQCLWPRYRYRNILAHIRKPRSLKKI